MVQSEKLKVKSESSCQREESQARMNYPECSRSSTEGQKYTTDEQSSDAEANSSDAMALAINSMDGKDTDAEANSSLFTFHFSLSKVAVLLTVFNRRETTLRCLEELFSQTKGLEDEFDVFLTNDGCTDGTPEAIRERFPQVHIVEGDGNLFWNRGMIAAWEAAVKHGKYDFFLWLNDDTILKEDAIARLMKYGKETKGESCIVGSCHAVGDPETLTYGGLANRKWRLYPSDTELKACKSFNGNVVLIPYKIYETIGMNDAHYHHSGGDFDYGYTATRAGFTNYIAPGYYGIVNRHERIPKWTDPKLSLKQRWKDFKSPVGACPNEHFYFNMKNVNIFRAVRCYISCHIHVLLPFLWSEKRMKSIKVKSEK